MKILEESIKTLNLAACNSKLNAFDLTVKAYLKKANKLKAMGQTQKAMEVFAKVTELDPNFREPGKYLFQKSGLFITFCVFQVESCKVCSTIANHLKKK